MKQPNTQSGFTLIEMAMVMMIIGMALAAGLSIYARYIDHNKVVDTSSNISLAARAVSDFRARFGRYPCPASLTAARGTPAYGREGDCNPNNEFPRTGNTTTDEAPADNATPGSFADGFFVERSARMIDADSDGTPETLPIVVRGSLPFRDLNLPEDFAYDGHNNRLAYAVTRRLAVQDTFNPLHGGIAIVDNQGTQESLLETPDSGLYVVFSHGEDSEGAYSRAGQPIEPCPGISDVENENCDVSSAEARYVHIRKEGSNDAEQFDDILSFYSGADDSLWEIAEEDTADIILRQTGRVGVNLKITTGTLPDDSVAVNGVLRAQQNYRAQTICDLGGSNCFQPELIGGAIADGGGMECPSGQYLSGITGGAPICEPIPGTLEIRCNPGQIMIGVNSDGTIKCSPPPVICASSDRTICGATETLPSATTGTQHWLEAGVSRRERYQCQSNGSWQTNPNSVTGVCTCDPAETLTPPPVGCGTGFAGMRPFYRVRQCPSGEWGPPVYQNAFADDCTCTGYTEYRDLACGPGYNTGVDRERRIHTCDGSNNLIAGSWEDDPANATPCACVEDDVSETNLACPGGLDGTYSRTNHFSCPSATWDGWVYDYSGCTCDDSKTRTRIVSCPAPQIGTITEQDTYSCTGGTTPEGYPEGSWDNVWTPIITDCETPPPTVCTWNPIGTPVQVVTQPSVPRAGKECPCGTGTSGCFEYGDPNYLKYNVCVCE